MIRQPHFEHVLTCDTSVEVQWTVGQEHAPLQAAVHDVQHRIHWDPTARISAGDAVVRNSLMQSSLTLIRVKGDSWGT